MSDKQNEELAGIVSENQEKPNTREKLEADVMKYLDLPANCRNWHDFGKVKEWLDRQKEITERECNNRQLFELTGLSCPDCVDERITELQAKVDELKSRHCPHYHVSEHYCDVHETRIAELQAKLDELQDENARLRTCMESDKEQHDEILAENAALEAELKLARGELKQVLNNHAQAEQRMKRKEQELDRKLALPPDEHLKELYELEKRNYEREVAENAGLRKVLDGIAKAARSRKLPKEEE